MQKIRYIGWSLCLLCLPFVGFADNAGNINKASEKAKAKLELGRATYYKQCYRCHEYGQRGAPMLGYLPDWEARLALGRDALIDSVIEGKGFMLPKATRDIQSRELVGLMVDYMTSTVTDDAIKNSPEMKAQVKRAKELANGMKRYGQACFSCHNTGRNGAPRLGDGLAWDDRKKQGLETLVKHAIAGHGRMIMKGGSNIESTKEIESIVNYMLSTLEPSLD